MLDQVLYKVEPNIDWAKEISANCIEYLKLMTCYDVPSIEINPEKVKPYFHKMEDGMSGKLTIYFMNFAAQAFTQSEKIRDNTTKCDEDWDTLMN